MFFYFSIFLINKLVYLYNKKNVEVRWAEAHFNDKVDLSVYEFISQKHQQNTEDESSFVITVKIKEKMWQLQ